MLDIANTRFFQWTEKPIAGDATVSNIVEGSPLVAVVEDGIGKVSLGTGTDTEVFEGVAFAGYVRPSSAPKMETFEVKASALVVSLEKKPEGDVMVYLDGIKATVAKTGNAAAGTVVFSAADNTLTFAVADAGKEAKVLYVAPLSLAEARALTGDGYAGGFILSELGGTIGVIHQGQVSTSEYDVTSDWTKASNSIKVNADGKFAIDGTGASVSNARILMAPGVDSAFLVLQLL